MLPGPRNRLRQTCARYGGKAIDAETTSKISLGIRVVQQLAIGGAAALYCRLSPKTETQAFRSHGGACVPIL